MTAAGPWDVGDTITLSVPAVVDANGAAANSQTVTATVTLPDGSPSDVSSTFTNPPASTGNYKGSVVASQAGRHKLRVVGSGGAALPWAFTDIFDVLPTDPLFIISLADAREALRKPGSDTVDDAELRLYVAAVTTIVEASTGPQTVQTKSVTRSGGKSAVLLPTNVVSVVSVTENGSALGAGDYTVDYDSGVMYRGSQVAPFPWLAGHDNIAISYTTGLSVVGSNVRLAARVILDHLWVADNSRPSMDDTPEPDEAVVMIAGYAVPNRAAQLLIPTPGMIPGFA